MGVRIAAVVGLLAAVALGVSSCGGPDVPQEYRSAVKAAGGTCKEISARLIAAQIEQESGWNPQAVSASGAEGIAQFMPETWHAWGTDGDDDGDADPFEPDDAIKAQGNLMCHLVRLAKESELADRPVIIALAAYNAGWGKVEHYGGVPPFPETRAYIEDITQRARSITLRD